MEKYRQRISVPKVKEAAEGRRLQTRLNSLQLGKDQPEDVPEDENAHGTLAVYSRSMVASHVELKTTLLSSIENKLESKEEAGDQKSETFHEKVSRHPYRHLLGSTLEKESFKKFMGTLFRGTIYSLKFLKGPSEKYLNSKVLALAEPKRTMLLTQRPRRSSWCWTSTRL